MKRIFITGVNGLLGTNLCHELLQQGYFVIGLTRKKQNYKGKEHKHLKLIEGDLFIDFTSLLNKVDVVIHVAATTSQNLLRYSDYKKINCNTTIQLYNAAIICNVKRFIFVSTANTLGYGSFQKPGAENNKMSKLFKQSYYAKSKFEAERYLLKNNHKIKTAIVNPTFMLGAYDTKPSSGKIIYMGWKKKVIFYPPGGKNFVHVKDVANGIIKVLTTNSFGEKYLLANENLSYKDFFNKLNKVTNQLPLMVQIPKFILIMIGYFGDVLRSMGIKTSLSLTNMRTLCINNFFSNTKSVRDLKIEYLPINKAIDDAILYFSKIKNN